VYLSTLIQHVSYRFTDTWGDAPFETPSECALPGTETEGDVETRVDGLVEAITAWTTHVALEKPAKGAVHDAVAFEEGGTPCARVGGTQQGN